MHHRTAQKPYIRQRPGLRHYLATLSAILGRPLRLAPSDADFSTCSSPQKCAADRPVMAGKANLLILPPSTARAYTSERYDKFATTPEVQPDGLVEAAAPEVIEPQATVAAPSRSDGSGRPGRKGIVCRLNEKRSRVSVAGLTRLGRLSVGAATDMLMIQVICQASPGIANFFNNWRRSSQLASSLDHTDTGLCPRQL